MPATEAPIQAFLTHQKEDHSEEIMRMVRHLINNISNRIQLNLNTRKLRFENESERREVFGGKRTFRVWSYFFLREFIRNPGSMGSICSSSERLATRIAAGVELQQEGWIIELGGGMGAVTAALLQRGVRPERLMVIEKSKCLVRYLRRRFPAVRIVHGDAADIQRLTKDCVAVTTIVSGLPLMSLSADLVKAILKACEIVLAPQGRLIQFTYALRGRSAWLSVDLKNHANEIVWMNFPPARIQIFTRGV